MSRISVTQTFKRAVFSFVVIFLTAIAATYFVEIFTTRYIATLAGAVIAISAGIYSYVKFPAWFKNKT